MSLRELREILSADALAGGRSTIAARFFGDEIWKFQLSLRFMEYCDRSQGARRTVLLPFRLLNRVIFHHFSLKLGFTIPAHVFAPGLSIPHYGTIVVSKHAKIGKNCRIHEGVTIGATNGTDLSPTLGDNVFIGSGAKILGDVTVADDVCIAANAVVTRSITEPGTTWAGAPARKISDHDSHANLNATLFS